MENEIQINHVINEEITNEYIHSNDIRWHILRLDLIHPIVSGNKYFKLKYFMFEAVARGYKGILTYGGPYSNHIVAASYAAKYLNLSSIGIIRGEKPIVLSHTLLNAEASGMKLNFISRKEFSNKDDEESITRLKAEYPEMYIIPEGGYGKNGAKGAGEILKLVDLHQYSHICCACGTGTMVAGIVNASLPQQVCVGISVLKGNPQLRDQVINLLDSSPTNKRFEVFHKFHFGGYAKKSRQLFNYMNEFYQKYGIPTDFIYTAKLMYAIDQLVKDGYFPRESRILAIHSGGLQGNESLRPGILVF